ncbi:hypothetical protein C5B89_06560 [Haloferax sp. Atlit-47N]|uniref:hypothetical protein n=1 Tax=Haloferax TaxID=2251 RepID=UPI0006778C82|nr:MULTISPECIES: hypothetical protein [unclassified Haloferax]RDZ41600.1 hypothetical protein C5B89_06560 [Haloferax sp. Atlit-47N]
MARTTLTYEDNIDDWIKNRLVAGQNRTIWLRYAVETTYAVDGMLDELFEPYQYDKRQELIEAAVRKEVDRRKRELGDN